MEFGKIADISGVDWRLPDDVILFEPTGDQQPQVYVGPTGWNMRAWVGGAYPPRAKADEYLSFYSRQFNTVEQNGTYYRMPDAASVARWVAVTPPDFRFCPKVPSIISVARDLRVDAPTFDEFADHVRLLGVRLGVAFLQLPQHFGAGHFKVLERFLSRHAGKIPLAVEGRHPDLFEGVNKAYFFDLLAAFSTGAVITDVAGRRDVLHNVLTTPQVLIRFVGHGLAPTDYLRIERWVARWKSWFEQGVTELYCFTHQPENLLAPEMTAFTVERVKQVIPQAVVRGPRLPYKPPDTPAPNLLF